MKVNKMRFKQFKLFILPLALSACVAAPQKNFQTMYECTLSTDATHLICSDEQMHIILIQFNDKIASQLVCHLASEFKIYDETCHL